ncbi:phenylacetate--CoA ligase family protein [Pontibacter sp. HSC-36F09]|uniref:phenylacetate--CoA ligase family protein n=1 Tax=Pontibacter sp. HSC-36F09 TaxID=2910966 RepID=UPI00209DC417|nr:hypothetical protein [Pontibacter sp. HSC-36F09]MCP2044259.1 phenylacetate-CoA ligase [Pontibacter sp. HSC-36F09]
MNNIISKIVYNLGVNFRNPSIKQSLAWLKETDNFSLEELEAIQLQKCKELLAFSYKYSKFYKKLFDEINFTPSQLKALEDLKLIPTINKKTLILHNADIRTSYSFNKVNEVETSGTSGESLKFYKDELWDSKNRAALFRYYSWYNVKPWEKNGYFWGYNVDKSKIFKTRILDFLQNRFRIFSYKEDEIKAFTSKLEKATYLHGYSSMIYGVAKVVNEIGLSQKYSLKFIKGTSEKIYDKYQDEVRKAFGLKIISEYGAGETGLIAFECPEGGRMHINMQNVIVEVEDDEIIVTNLLSNSFPIIRYKLGDYVKLAPKNDKCICGRQHLIIDDVQGRVGKLIIGKEHSYPSLTFYYVFKNLGLEKNILLNYQAIQYKPGYIQLKIEQNMPEVLSAIDAELVKYFKNDIEFEVIFDQKLHAMNGKLRDFISHID